MSDLENKPGLDEANEEEKNVQEELEELRDLFQKELDLQTETYLAGGDIQEYDDEEESDEYEDETESLSEENLCECCGEKKRDTSVSPDYPYCSDCRSLMQHYPIGFKGVLTLVVALVLSCLSIFMIFSKNADAISTTLDADSFAAEGKLYSALYAYYDAVSASNSDFVPKKTVAKCARAFAMMNDYSDGYSFASRYLSESDLKLPTYKFIEKYSKINNTLTVIQNMIYEPLSKPDRSADDAEKICEDIENLRANGDSEYDDFSIDYYKYVVMHTLEVPLEKQLEELKKIDEKYSKDQWIYSYDLCAVAARLGDIETAEKYFDVIMKNNTEDSTAHAYLADAYRFCETPDPDKMLEIVEQGFKAQGSYEYANCDLYRVQALAYMLKGDYESAFESAEQSYQAAYASSFSVNNLFPCLYTYMICGSLTENKTAVSTVENLLKQNGFEGPEEIQAFLAGEIELKVLIVNSEGELV